MRSEPPLVSVFCPTYQHEAYIADAIEAIIAQDYPNIELVIGDDASSDGTWAIVENYQRLYPDLIKAVRNERNLGVTGNCNAIIERCRGKYIGFYAGDDLWLPGKVRRQVEVMEADPSCAFAYHDVEVFDDTSGRLLYRWNSGRRRPRPIEGDANRVLQHLVGTGAGFMSALSVMIRRSRLSEGHPYDSRLPHVAELMVWVDVLSGAPASVRYLPEVLARYRKHSAGLTAQNFDVEIDMFLAIVENEHPELLDDVRQARAYRYYAKGVARLTAGEARAARQYLMLSARNGGHSPKLIYWLAKSFFLNIQSLVSK